MKGWKEGTLNDLVTLQRGFDITKSEQTPGSVPVISSSGIGSYHATHKVKAPGVVIGRKGTLGTVFYSDVDFWPHDTTLWVKDFHGNDPRYCFYFLKSMNFEKFDVGAANPTLNRNHIHLLPIVIPPFDTQRKISNILSRFDELITTNSKTTELLQKMALSFYREWFVNFKFPAHEKVKTVDSGHPDFGMIPEGWRVVKLGDTATIDWGDTRKTKSIYTNSGFTAFSASGPDGKIPYFDFERDGIVLSAIGANCGATWFATGKWSCIKNTIKFWSSNADVPDSYLFYATYGNNFFPKRGAAQPFISKGDCQEKPILLADSNTYRLFNGIVHPALHLAANIIAQSRNLVSICNLLLPRFITGELDVSEISLEKMVENSASKSMGVNVGERIPI